MTNFTNEALQAFVEEYGDQIIMIRMDDGHKFFFGADRGENTRFIKDIQYKTVGGVDLFGISHVDKTWNHDVPFTTWWTTSYIQAIITLDDPDCQYLPDLNKEV